MRVTPTRESTRYLASIGALSGGVAPPVIAPSVPVPVRSAAVVGPSARGVHPFLWIGGVGIPLLMLAAFVLFRLL